MWTAAILAGGRARRLGGLDKSALPVDERFVLDRQLGMLRALTPHILIVGHDDPRYREAGVSVVVDRIAGRDRRADSTRRSWRRRRNRLS